MIHIEVRMINFAVAVLICLQMFIRRTDSTGCVFSFNSAQGNFSSPGFPSKILTNKQCAYSITTSPGSTIQLNFLYFDLGQLGCSYAEFKVYEGTNSSGTLALTKCGGSRDPYISIGNHLFITFKAIYMTTPGFQVQYAMRQGCNMILENSEGTFISPRFPSNYPNSISCSYKITGPPASRIYLIFSKLRIEPSSSCTKDRLTVHEGSDTKAPISAVKCGTNTTQYLSTGNSLFLQFTTDSSETEEGFRIFYGFGPSGCDRIFTGASGNISSPMFPSTYPNNVRCTYKITVPEDHLIQLTFRSFQLPGYGDTDRLNIFEGEDESGLLTDSRTWTINYPYVSTGNKLFLVFQTDSIGTSKGFDIQYASRKGCNIHMSSVNGILTSPLYPYQYQNGTSCNYTITVAAGKRVHLYFQKFELEDEESCAYDNLKIFEGSSSNGTLAETLCGTLTNKQFISASNQVFLQFKTNNRISKTGFLANYYTTQLNCNGYFSAVSGTIQSQNFPNNYPNNAQCTYQIRGRSGKKIQLIFSTFLLQNSTGCRSDSFKVYKGAVSESSLVDARCGSNVTEIMVEASQLFIVFNSDMSKADKGFQIFFQVGEDGCGGVYNAEKGLIASPSVSGKYPNNAKCRYKITGPIGKRISLLFSTFAFQYHEHCKYDNVKVYDGLSPSNRTLLATRCGSDVAPILSMSNQVLLELSTDGSVTGTGFQIYYFVGDKGCSKSVKTSTGTILSPFSPNPYPNNAFCTYLIEVLENKRIELTFQSFMLQPCCSPTSCDTLRVFDGGDSSKPLLKSMCGTQHSRIQSSSNQLFIEFKSDGSIPNYGFKANFISKEPGFCQKYRPCRNNGTCIEASDGSYRCQCLSRFTGVNCTTSFVPCSSNPCVNGGICKDVYEEVSATFECICLEGFTGNRCQTRFDECLGYHTDSRWQRSVGNKEKPDDSAPYCDRSLTSGWYRFTSKAGPDMPTSCPSAPSCGTSQSVWANGTLPRNVGDYATLQVCVRNDAICCFKSWSIKVKRCMRNGTTFNIYQLTKPPSCPMVYCAGVEIPCRNGSNSPTGFTPGCTYNFPKISSIPEIAPGITSNKLQFTCKFESTEEDSKAVFEVTWYKGSPAEKINKTSYLKGPERIATLQNRQEDTTASFTLGTVVFCRVRSWYEVGTYAVSKSPFRESNHYFAGIQIQSSNHQNILSESGTSLKLSFRATVPIVAVKGKNCIVKIQLSQNNEEGLLSTCKIEFKPGPANQTQVIEVIAKRDFVIDGNKRMTIHVTVSSVHCPDWNNHQGIPDIVIIIIDVHTERCQSSGDPHLITFDKLYYNHFEAGDYVLVNSTCRLFEVHVRTWKCAAVTCNCGIAAREGDDVIVVDMCRDGIPRARFASKSKPAPGTSILRDETGKSFIINFPSGAFIRMDNYRWYGNTYYANVVVQVGSDDFNCTVGLCGTFDRNKQNDMRSKSGKVYTSMDVGMQAPSGFSESWRIPGGKSLFYYTSEKDLCKKTPRKQYCICKRASAGSKDVKCRHSSVVNRPNYLSGRTGWRELRPTELPSCKKRKRRSVDQTILLPSISDEDAFYVYNPGAVGFAGTSWPTPLKKTKVEVEAYCHSAVTNSKPGKVCSVIPGFDFGTFSAQCTADVQISDSYGFSISAVRSMQDACEEIFLKNTSYWNTATDGSVSPPRDIAKTLCPSLCSGQGSCINATCVCNENYTAADCSVSKGSGPSGVTVASNGLCDARTRSDCHVIRIRGYNLIDSEKLLCRTTKITINKRGYAKTSPSATYRAYLLSFAEAVCQINNHSLTLNKSSKNVQGASYEGYLLELSNDGKIFSKEETVYLIFDSECIECNASNMVLCKIKKSKCMIDGYCFDDGEVSRFDRSSKCNPAVSQNTFTQETSQKSKSNLAIVLACTCAAIIVAILIVAFVVFKWKNKKGKVILPAEEATGIGQQFENSAYEGQIK